MGLFIGVMSGTSMDAVDCALVEFKEHAPPRLEGAYSTPWPSTLRERLQTVAAGSPLTSTDLGRLDTAVGQFIAEAVNALLADSGLDPTDIAALGSHGQTVAHAPDGEEPTTVQLGDGNVIAERTGITTVSDFRRRDIAAGGQGAPLAPAFHDAVLRSLVEDRVVMNLGGIANITVLPADPEVPATGFDVGPANCLMDLWAGQHLGRPYDEDGRWAASGSADSVLLERLLGDPYFALPPPKSTGTQHFSLRWLQGRLAGFSDLEADAVQATLLDLTVTTIGEAISRYAPRCERVLACGGGVNNQTMMTRLRGRLERPVEPTTAYGIDPQRMEPMAFAWLASLALANRASNIASISGARGPRILGTVHPAHP